MGAGVSKNAWSISVKTLYNSLSGHILSLLLLGRQRSARNERAGRCYIFERERNMQTLVYVFYICGSLCFLAGSILSLVLMKGG